MWRFATRTRAFKRGGREADDQAVRPRIRALFVHGCLQTADQMWPEVHEALENRLGFERLRNARSTMRLSWLSVEDLWDLGRAIDDVCTPREQEQYWFNALDAQLDGGFLSPIVQAAFAIHGRTPLALARWTPKAWRQLFPEAPKVDFLEGEEPFARIHMTDWPSDPDMLRIFRTALHGVFRVFFARAGVEGEVHSDQSGQDLHYELRWRSKLAA